MGTYLSIPRLPMDWAVDLLSNRRDIGDIKRERRDLIENGYFFWLDDRPSDPPRKLNLNRFYVRALDAMTETLHDSLFYEFFHDDHEEPDGPGGSSTDECATQQLPTPGSECAPPEPEESSLPSSLGNDIAVADTSDFNCGTPNGDIQAAFCASESPKEADLEETKNAFDRIEQRGSVCADLVKRGRRLLSKGDFRYFDQTVAFGIGGIGSPDYQYVLLARLWLSFVNLTGSAEEPNGTTVRINLDFAIAHELDHVFGRDHIVYSDGTESEWVTPNAKRCSGLY